MGGDTPGVDSRRVTGEAGTARPLMALATHGVGYLWRWPLEALATYGVSHLWR